MVGNEKCYKGNNIIIIRNRTRVAKILQLSTDLEIETVLLFSKQMVEIYNSTYKELRIMPYDYQHGMSPVDMQLFCDAPDKLILQASFYSISNHLLVHSLNFFVLPNHFTPKSAKFKTEGKILNFVL